MLLPKPDADERECQKQAAEAAERLDNLRQQASVDSAHDESQRGMQQQLPAQAHHQSDSQLAPVPQQDTMVFRGKFRSLITGGACSKITPASSEQVLGLPAATDMHVGAKQMSASSDSIRLHESSGKHISGASIGGRQSSATDSFDMEKWLGVSNWCRYDKQAATQKSRVKERAL